MLTEDLGCGDRKCVQFEIDFALPRRITKFGFAEALGRRVRQARQALEFEVFPLVLAEALGCRVRQACQAVEVESPLALAEALASLTLCQLDDDILLTSVSAFNPLEPTHNASWMKKRRHDEGRCLGSRRELRRRRFGF